VRGSSSLLPVFERAIGAIGLNDTEDVIELRPKNEQVRGRKKARKRERKRGKR
jgi:hypothetical protein